MIPSIVADEVVQALRDFLLTGFKPSNPELAGVIDDFLSEPANLARGPYLSLSLPFSKSPGPEPFPEVPLGFPPYRHQRTAMERLASATGKPTMVATGTGSGKTECYLLPILDHCREQSGKPGIKAIVIYPMNALAMDQATRIARVIDRNPVLHDRVTAGLYVGGREETPRKTMTADHVITDRETLRQHPPDILLTNYKMLDYLMIRPSDQRLWRHNEPGTLRYLVVDELHTFDGAQGTDLACLIRRLRSRLQGSEDELVCAGTSATIGTGDDDPVRKYASRVFNQEFEPGSVVGETRQTPEELLGGALITGHLLPSEGLAEALDPRRHDTSASYKRAAYEGFFNQPPEGDPDSDDLGVGLANRLREHTAFRNLLQVLGGYPKPLAEVVSILKRTMPVADDEQAAAVLNALCALIAAARVRDEDGRTGPFLDVGIHLWVRELARMVCSVSEGGEGSASEDGDDGAATTAPVRRLRHSDDLQAGHADDPKGARSVHLPLIQCRECRVTGWAAVKRAHQSRVEPDLRVFYTLFFRRDLDVRFLFPGDESAVKSVEHLLCGRCGWLSMGDMGHGSAGESETAACAKCESNRVVRLHAPDAVKPAPKGGTQNAALSRDCPYCRAKEGLIIFGARAASLTSVLCSQTFGSRHNDDPKALAFSDNVQNAAHRAGFVAARSLQTHTRSAIAQVAAAHDGISLEELPGAVADYWRERAGTPDDFVGEHIANDRRWLRRYRARAAGPRRRV